MLLKPSPLTNVAPLPTLSPLDPPTKLLVVETVPFKALDNVNQVNAPASGTDGVLCQLGLSTAKKVSAVPL